tara:strand:+ start:22848 stop:23039 length:192 start_codon:yes stop_codon:yes gene_type:complete
MKELNIQVYSAEEGHYEMLEQFEQILDRFNIDCFNDEQEAKKEDVDLYIRIIERKNDDRGIIR